MPKQNAVQESRRDFLRTLTIGASVATVALVTKSATAARSEDTAPLADTGDVKQGYHVTQHIVDYYKSAAF